MPDAALGCLFKNVADTPFLLAFEIGEDGMRFASSKGLEADSSCCNADAWAIDLQSQEISVVDLPPGLQRPFAPWVEPVARAAIIPVSPPGASAAQIFVVAAISPRLSFNHEYALYLGSAAERLARAVADAQALEAARRRAEALAELDRAKTVFFSNISHEFRTPLTLMLNPIDELIESHGAALTPDESELLSVAKRNGLRLQRLVNTLLDFSRIEAGKVDAVFEPTDLASYTRDLASNFRSAIERAGLRYTVDCPPHDDIVYVDRDMWEKIVLNLISNALKYTHAGEIEVLLKRRPSSVELIVRDTGVGISEKELPRLFERFYRVPNAKGRTFEGSGIGLALVQELVKLHNGTVSVESKSGHGSAFTVSIPGGRDHLDPERVGADRKLDSTAIRAEAFVQEALRWLPDDKKAAKRTARPLILLADDNADMRAYIRRLLEPLYDIDVAFDGVNALEKFDKRRPDLVLTDIMMPKLDGFGVLKAIRSHEDGHQTPVIMLSARAGEQARNEGIRAGADDYLVKPFSARELLTRVSSRLELAHRHTEPARRAEEKIRTLSKEAQLLRQLFDHATVFIALLTGPEHIFEFVNEKYMDVTGANEAIIGRPIREAFPEVETEVFFMLDNVFRTGKPHTDQNYKVTLNRGPGDTPVEGYYDFTAQAVFNADGTVSGVLLEGVEVTHRVLAERRQLLMIEELNHRVKNSLATVQSIASQSFRDVKGGGEAKKNFEARLNSLARAHSALTRGNWESVTLREIVDQELSPYSQVSVAVSGVAILLAPKAALTVAMVIHELTTNAAKYGALSKPEGKLSISWRVGKLGDEPSLNIDWRESGVTVNPAPAKNGFGARLVTQSVSGALEGEIDADYSSGGLHCKMQIPLKAILPERIAP